MKGYYSFSFEIDPNLNSGFNEAFNQGGEQWWWFTKPGETGAAAGGPPDLTGARCKAVHEWDRQIWP